MQSETHDRNTIDDQWFKTLVHDGHILAEILRVMPEFRDRSREEILTCLELDGDKRHVKGRGTELGTKGSTPVHLDSVFDVTLPGTGKGIEIIVGVEGQNYIRGDVLANRQLLYSSRMITEQEKGTTKQQLYENMKRTVSIWVRLNASPEARNRVVRDYRMRHYLDAPGEPFESPLNKMEIYEINIGGYSEREESPVGMLNLLFTKDLDTGATQSKLREKYDILIEESLIGEVKKMGALADEYEYLMQSSYEKGEASGYEKGEASGFKKGEASGFEKGETSVREDFINYWVDEVTRLVRTKGMSLEEAMDDCRVRSEYISAVSERCRAILHGV